jgi:hypothetical protein
VESWRPFSAPLWAAQVDFEAHRDDAATRWLDSPLLADTL